MFVFVKKIVNLSFSFREMMKRANVFVAWASQRSGNTFWSFFFSTYTMTS